MTLDKTPTFRRGLFGAALFVALAGLTATGFAEQEPISAEKAQMIGYVEDFFMNNFRDITMRRSLEWGDVRTDQHGNRTIRYRCEALIWNKERKTLGWDFTFDKDGKYVAHQNVEGAPGKNDKEKSSEGGGEEKTADRFLGLLADQKFEQARAMGIPLFQASISAEKLGEIWKNLSSICGRYLECSSTASHVMQEYRIFDKTCRFEKGTVTFRISVDRDGKIAGFFLMNVVPAPSETPVADAANSPANVPADSRGSRRVAAAGWRLFMQGKPGEAEPKFKEAVRLDPKNANAYQGLGWAQTHSGRHDDAKKTFAQCLELDPKNTAALNGLGVIARNEGDEKTMLDVWQRAVDMDKKATGPIAGLADFHEKKGEKETAAQYYRMWNQADPDDENAKEGLRRTTAP